jgi:hypothetical protein
MVGEDEPVRIEDDAGTGGGSLAGLRDDGDDGRADSLDEVVVDALVPGPTDGVVVVGCGVLLTTR